MHSSQFDLITLHNKILIKYRIWNGIQLELDRYYDLHIISNFNRDQHCNVER